MDSKEAHDFPIDPIAAVVHPDPYPYYDLLCRSEGLVFDDRLKLWVAARAADVEQVLADPRLRVRPVHEPVPRAIAGGSAGEVFSRLVRMNEGETAHVRPKQALQEALSAIPLGAVTGRTRARARSIALRGVEDLSAWTFELPVSVVASWLGFADAQLPSVAAHVGRFVACLSPLSSAAQIEAAHASAALLLDDIKPLLADGVGLAGQIAAQAREVGWTQVDGLVANLFGLLSQTYEATAGLIGNAIVGLVRDAALRRRFQPAGIRTFVEEVAQRDPVVHNTRRFASEDLNIGGASLKQGDAILVILAAANRDGDRQFGFGHGRHACPGQAIAITMAAAAIGELLHADPSILDQPLRWTYRPSANARIPVFTTQGPTA